MDDVVAERGVLGGIFTHGSDAYFDVADILHPDSFTVVDNKTVYNCIIHIFKKDDGATVDEARLLSAAIELGYDKYFQAKTALQHLRTLLSTKTSLENCRHFAAKIRKLHIARLLAEQCGCAIEELNKLDGTESIDKILSIPEGKIFELNDQINQNSTELSLLSEGLDAHLDYIEENPVDMIGISTGYKRYDDAIGGGLRRKEIDIIGARMKIGKSQLADNISMYITLNMNIPVMNLDTEMSREQHWYRILSNLSGVKKRLIETGQYAKDPLIRQKVRDAADKLNKAPYYYECISGKPFEDVLATLRRWIQRKVGVDDNGKTKDCVVVYDYLKLIDDSNIKVNMAEYQALGFMMMSLKNFLIRYDVPCLSFIQLNRDGIDVESTAVASGSDRILMYCSSASIFKPKSQEELAEDGVENGNRKLLTLICRNGGGLDDGDYINMQFDGDFSRITELHTKKELNAQNKSDIDKGIENSINEDDDIPFSDE